MVVKKYLLTNLTADAVVFKVIGDTDADVERLFSGALYTLQKSQFIKTNKFDTEHEASHKTSHE